MKNSIIVNNLSKKYSNKLAVKNLNFKINENQIIGLLGPNGCGKTTTIGMIFGLLKPTSGEILINGLNIEKNRIKLLHKINFISPYIELPKKLTVKQNLLVYGKLYSVKNLNYKIEYLSEKLRLKNFLNRITGELSSGQKNRVSLAKALINDPSVLLLDEPTASLDPETSIFIRNYLLEYQKKNRSSILITSHNLNEVQAMCSNIILLKSGEIVSQGNIKKVLKKYNYKTLIELFLSEG